MTSETPLDFDRLARFYDREHDPFDADVPLYLGLAERTGGPILELGCGSGRLLAPLARAGFEIWGIDSSSAMLALAQRRLEKEQLLQRVHLYQQDMRRLKLDTRFKLAFIAINTFAHLISQEDQLQALTSWHQHLQPGGLLVVDVFNPDLATLLESQGQLHVDHEWHDPQSGAHVIKSYSRRHDQATQTQYILLLYDEVWPNGSIRRTAVPVTMRYLWKAEGELLLRLTGFAVEAVYGDYDLTPFDSHSERILFVARRA